MKIFGRDINIEIRKADVLPDSGLANPEQWLLDCGGSSYAGVSVNEQTALRMSAVWSCVKNISEDVASLPFILYKRESGDKKARAKDHRLYPLLHDRPNPEMTAFSFWQTMMFHVLTRGNAYAEIERDRLGRVISLYPIPQDQYFVLPEREKGQIVYHVRSLSGGSESKIASDKMLHVMGLSTSGLLGLSPIRQAMQGIGLGIAAEQFGASFFGNGANVGSALKHPGKLSKEAHDRLRSSWADKHEGLKNSHKPAILEEGMEYVRVGIPPEEAQFIETRKFQIADIARIYRMPPHMIGELDRATWANIEHQSIEYVKHTLGPWLKNIEQSVCWKLLDARERADYFAEYLVEALLRGDTKSRYEAYAIARQNGWMNANEIRRKENDDPYDGGDVFLVPLNMIDANDVGKQTDPNAQAKRGMERRSEASGPDARRELCQTFAPVFADVFDRIFKREKSDVLRRAKKKDTTPDDMAAWLEEYYAEHPSFCARTILPALKSYADAVGKTTNDETEAEWNGLSDDLKAFVSDYADTFGQRESISSRMRAIAVVRRSEQDETDLPTALEEMFSGWDETRNASDTNMEATQASNAIVKAILIGAGVQVLRWSAGLKACPLCRRMDGRLVSIHSNFLASGDVVEGDSTVNTLTVDRDFGHAPLHGGCTCQVTQG